MDRTFAFNERLLIIAKLYGDLISLSMRHNLPIIINLGSRIEKDIQSQESSKVHALSMHDTAQIIVEDGPRKRKIQLAKQKRIALTSIEESLQIIVAD